MEIIKEKWNEMFEGIVVDRNEDCSKRSDEQLTVVFAGNPNSFNCHTFFDLY